MPMAHNSKKLALLTTPSAIASYYFLIACVWTYPLIFNLRSYLAGEGDAWQTLWNFWWIKTSLFDLHTNPLFTHLMYWPSGISLLFHTLSFTNSVPAAILQYAIGYVAAYNILLLLTFPLTGLAGYFLAHDLTHDRLASFAAGYIVTFSAYHFAHYSSHLNLMTIHWLLFFVVYFMRLQRNATSWRPAALFLILTGLTEWYLFSYAVIFVILFYTYGLLLERDEVFQKQKIRDMLVMFVVAGIVLAPILVPMITAKLFDPDFNVIGHDPVFFSTDAAAFFIPNYVSIFQKYTRHYWSVWTGNWETVAYLGYAVLALAAYTLWWIRSKISAFWAFVAVVFAVLSMGPFLHIQNHMPVLPWIHKPIPLPYLFLDRYVPFMQIQGVPTRMMLMAYAGMAVLAALALNHLCQDRSRRWLAYALIALLVIEYAPTHFVLSHVDVPAIYTKLASDPRQYAILDVSADAKVLYYQTLHHKPIVGGYTSRTTVSTTRFLQTTPVISSFIQPEPASLQPLQLTPSASKEILRNLGVRYVVLNSKDSPRMALAQSMELVSCAADDVRTIFEVADIPR